MEFDIFKVLSVRWIMVLEWSRASSEDGLPRLHIFPFVPLWCEVTPFVALTQKFPLRMG
jgi:hypothetical protein